MEFDVMHLQKRDALEIIQNCANQYRDKLENNNVMFVSAVNGKASFFETVFLARNFLHLTGVDTELDSNNFFSVTLDKRLDLNDFSLTSDGLTEKKLTVLPKLMNIHTTARMIGDHNRANTFLVTDKLAGTVTAAMGFVEDNGLYLPNTVLKTDVRLVTKHPQQRVIAVFVKSNLDEKYSRLTYIANGITIKDDILEPILSERVDVPNLTAAFDIPGIPSVSGDVTEYYSEHHDKPEIPADK
jgi:hypothetical protein